MMSGKQQRIWNRRYVINLLILTAALLIPCLTACGGSSSGTTLQPEILTPPGVGDTAGTLPAGLPEDGYVDPAEIIARRGSVYDQTTITGLDYSGCGPGTMPGPASLLLVPGTEPVAWALYSFADNLAEDTPLMLTVELTPALPSRLFLAIADYDSNSWHWLSFDNPGAGINLVFPAELQPVSRGGRINVLLLVEAGDNASISALRLHRDVVAPPPADFATGRDYPRPDMISLSWTDPAVTWPGLSYDAVRIERATVSPGTWEVLADIPAGQTEYADTWSTENDIPYDWDVYYRLRTVVGDIQGLPCIRTPGRRLLQEITQFTASDGDYPDRVRLTWDPVPGAESYELDFYFGTETLPASEGITEYDYYWDHFSEHPMGVGEWDGCNVKLRACWQELTTDWVEDYGYRDIPSATNIQATEGVYPDKIVITWDPIPGVTGYLIRYNHHLGGIGVPPYPMALVEGQETCSFEHTYDDPELPELIYNHVYSYGVAGQIDGYYNDEYYGSQANGYRSISSPAGLSASDDLFDDRIRLTWEPVNGATAYLVYRDGMDAADLVATLGDVTTWDDLGITDTGLHHYWVRSIWMEYTSEFSQSDTGSVNMFDHHSTGLPSIDSLAIVDNKPMFTYSTSLDDVGLYYFARSVADHPSTAGDWTAHELMECDPIFNYSAVADIGGRPGACFRVSSQVTYAYPDSVTPDDIGDWHLTEAGSSSARELNVVEINGRPALAFTEIGETLYTYADEVFPDEGSDWHMMIFYEYGHSPVRLVEQDNLPLVLAGSIPLLFKASTATPATVADWTYSPVSQGFDARCASLCLLDNRPLISVTEHSLGYLHYFAASVPEPDGPEDYVTYPLVSDGDTYILDNCIAVYDGRPVVAYLQNPDDGLPDRVMFARARTADPARIEDWDFRAVACTETEDVQYSQLQMVVRDDKPEIAYIDNETGTVVYATLRD